jgi:hypothetical protein
MGYVVHYCSILRGFAIEAAGLKPKGYAPKGYGPRHNAVLALLNTNQRDKRGAVAYDASSTIRTISIASNQVVSSISLFDWHSTDALRPWVLSPWDKGDHRYRRTRIHAASAKQNVSMIFACINSS